MTKMNMHWRVRGWPPPSLLHAYTLIPKEGSVLDVGCLGYHQYRISKSMGLNQLKHFGVDWGEGKTAPADFNFRKADLNKDKLPFPDDSFDFVVVSHLIEHLDHPVQFFGDCIRVCKPGGILYFEAPSERSMWVPGNPKNWDDFYTVSYFDDPTHTLRVWTPQAFYRLARIYSCDPIKAGHLFSWIHRLLAPLTIPFCWLTGNRLLETCVWQTIGWATFMIAKKPLNVSGQPPFHYYIPNRKYKFQGRTQKDDKVSSE
jgi:SAM-dependent methyltransferase